MRANIEDCRRVGDYLVGPGMNLFRAKLADQELRLLDLRGTDFRGADLRGVDFAFSDLRGALFEGASLTSARFFFSKGALPRGWYLVDGYAYKIRQDDDWKFTSTRHETARENLEHEISKIRYAQQVSKKREAERIKEMLNPVHEENDEDIGDEDDA